MKRFILNLLFGLCCATCLPAQQQPSFVKRISLPAYDVAFDVAPVGNDGYIVGGFGGIFTPDTGFVIRLNASGEILWAVAIPDARINVVLPRSLGGFWVAGEYRTTNSDALVLRLAENGQLVWSRIMEIDVNAGDWWAEMLEASDGALFLYGVSDLIVREYGCLAKLDASGNTIWAKKDARADASSQLSAAMTLDDAGNPIVSTYHSVAFPVTKQAQLSKFDRNSGNLLWSKTYERNDDPFNIYSLHIHSVKPAEQDNLLISTLRGVFKTDPDGEVLWARDIDYKGGAWPYLNNFFLTSDGNYAAGGTYGLPFFFKYASYILNISPQGDLIASKLLPGCGHHISYEWKATPDGGFVVSGTTEYPDGHEELLIAKTDAQGNVPACTNNPAAAFGLNPANITTGDPAANWEDWGLSNEISDLPYLYRALIAVDACGPDVTIDLGEDIATCNDSVLLEIPGDWSMILWSNGSDSSVLRVDTSGLYTVGVLTGCGVRSDSIAVQFELCPSMVFPNAFTPNGDAINDVFRPIAKDVNIVSFRVFNRWGTEVYQGQGNNVAWDGLHNGEPAASDVYVWTCEYVDLQSGTTILKKGDVALLR